MDLPTPFTPTMDMTYGRGVAEVVVVLIARRRSSDVVGVSM